MQKRSSVSATDHQLSDIQTDPVLEKLFEDAIEVLRLAGADGSTTAEYGYQSLEGRYQESEVPQGANREKKKQAQQKNEKQMKKLPTITKSKRRKLERIKAPVTVLRKAKKDEVPSEEEQERSVKKMLCYVNQMPSQETFQPPLLPFVSLSVDESDETDHSTEDRPDTSASIQDYTYLSSEKDVALWKMLVASPTNCNVFVGSLSHDVTSEILHATFEAFILKEEDKAQLKAHVVMDVARQQSKGYGFVTFPCRRSAELALICMQDFEIHGRAMQLGWGQENREEKMANAEEFRVTITDQEQHSDKVCGKRKGNVFSDTVYSDTVELSSKQSLKRCSSRWDQEQPKKYQRMEESAKLDRSHEDLTPGCKEESLMSDVCQPILPHGEQLDNSTALNETVSSNSGQTQRRGVQWVTHDQRVQLLKTVCSNLRASEVRGHVGVFGVHYEADNSRLYVVCAKHVTESKLLDEFSVFGTAQVKLNTDANGFSKGCAFVQYTSSKCAEKAIKQLHGKVVGGMPMKVMVAEPKVRKGSRTKKGTAQL